MPKGIPNKRYTPEFKKKVIETMQEEKLAIVKRRSGLRLEVTGKSEIGERIT